MENIIQPVAVLGLLGGLFGVLLSLASKVFKVEVDPKITAVLDALPGANCGACGFPGCEGLATAIAEGKAPANSCPIGGQPVAEKVAEIIGGDVGEVTKMVASVRCQGSDTKAKDKYEYDGINDCRIQSMLSDGCKECAYGCIGCGTCVDVCPFDAIDIIDGIAVVNRDKCTGCNNCVVECPKNIIELVPYDNKFIVLCNSEDKGNIVRKSCEVGCIGCGLCAKACPKDAITVTDFLAEIDYEKCVNCSLCSKKCPTGAIGNFKSERKKERNEK